MNLAFLPLGLGLLLAGALIGPRADVPPPAYSILNTQVRPFTSSRVGSDFNLYISLPRNYDQTSDRYPLVLLLDADYSFAIMHNAVWHFADRQDLAPMILVGIAYPGAIEEADRHTYKLTRSRDYTPTHVSRGGYGPEYQLKTGGGDHFLNFVEDELVPYLAREFRLQPNNRAIVGHSYGGLLATYALLTRPQLFQRYLIVSPSYWYDRGAIYRIEAEAARKKADLKAKVFLAIGEKEKSAELDMVRDMANMQQVLASRRYPGLRLTSRVMPDETHDGVFPGAATHGIRWLFTETQPNPQ